MKPIVQEDDFYKVINRAIAEGRHVQYLQDVLKKYEEYKREFDKRLTEKNPVDVIYVFRVTYLSKKPVIREIEIYGRQTFDDLANEIIASMKWENDHMHGFEFLPRAERDDPFFTGSQIAFFAPYWEDDPHPTFKSDEICICNIDYDTQKKMEFIFDFGDYHQFEIEHIEMRKWDFSDRLTGFPRIIKKSGRPPKQYPIHR